MFDVILLKEMCDKHAWKWDIVSMSCPLDGDFVVDVYSAEKKAKIRIFYDELEDSTRWEDAIHELETLMIGKE